MKGIGVDMRETGESRIVHILCILLFIYEVTVISHTGIRIMLPLYVYGSYEETAVWEDIVDEQARTFFFFFSYPEKNIVIERRKDVIELKKLEKGEMLTLMELENSGLGQEIEVIEQSESAEEQESETAGNVEVTVADFVKREKVSSIALAELSDFETLVKRFYTIDAITNIGADELNAEKLGNMDMTMKQTADQPQILIYRTHSLEGYVDSVAGDDSTTIMGVGEHLKEILESEYGYHVLHHMGKYDVETRDSAYSRSLPEIEQLLADNPTIEVVIDLHRDAVSEDTHLVMDVDGKPTAKFMFFNGISRTTKNGRIHYLYNENLEMNLAFSFQAKWKAEEYYPGLTRRNYLNAYRYNMHVCPKTMLIELGAQNNTLEEAMNACGPIAHILHIVLSGEE